MQLITEGGGAAGAWPAPGEGNMTYGIHATLHRMESFDGSVNARRLRLQRLSHANEPFFVTIHRGVSWCLSFVCCHPRWEVCFWQARHNRCNIAPENPPVKAVAAGVRHTCALTCDTEHHMQFTTLARTGNNNYVTRLCFFSLSCLARRSVLPSIISACQIPFTRVCLYW